MSSFGDLQHRLKRTCKYLMLLFMAAYSAGVAPTATSQATRTLDCRNPDQYRLVVVDNPNRKKASDGIVPTDLNIVVGDEVIARIELPNGDSVKNFSLDSIKKNKVGFEIRTNWGASLYHYEVQFNFRCKGNNFYLYRVTKISLSTTHPDSGNFWDKKETKVTTIKPKLPIKKFVMIKYL